MSLYVEPKQSILDAANAQNSTTLTMSDVTFGAPSVAPDDVVTTTGKNSQVRLTGNGSTWSGTVVVNYTRLNLADITTLTSNTLRVAALTSTIDVMNYLNFYYGMVLTTDDIEAEDVTLDANGAGTATLHAKAGSMGWIGSVTLNLVKGDALVDYVVSDTSLSGINYPSGQSTVGQAVLAMYAFDFTSNKAVVETVPVDTVLNDTANTGTQHDFAAMIATVTGRAWAINAAAGLLNLMNAKVIYQGLNSAEFSTNQDYKYVTMIQLSDGTGNNGVVGTLNTGFRGALVLHYNDPVA